MSIPVIRMARTAVNILYNRGPMELLRAINRKLRFPKNKTSSQNDINIAFDILEASKQSGVMIDVGAHYGETLDRFTSAGWDIFAFEPDSKNRNELIARGYGAMSNVHIDPSAVSDKSATDIPLFRSEESTGISGLSAFHQTHVQGETVSVTTLALYIEAQAIGSIDFLKIDTEGFDLFVLKGFPWERDHPKLILCEFEDSKTIPLGYTFHDMAGFLEKQGYRLIVSEFYPVKRYGIDHDWRRFVSYPCELADFRAWGNIFAAKEPLYSALADACNLNR